MLPVITISIYFLPLVILIVLWLLWCVLYFILPDDLATILNFVLQGITGLLILGYMFCLIIYGVVQLFHHVKFT